MAEIALNAISINEATGDITLACGATGYFKIEIQTDGVFDTDKDVGVFAVARKRQSSYTTIFRRHYPIVSEAEGLYSITVDIANEDTREIAPGSYVWTMLLVTGPEYDENEQVIVEDRLDGVYPLYQGDAQPIFELQGVAHVI